MAFPPKAPRGAFNPRFRKEQQQEHRTNQMIRVPEVRLVGDNIEPGIFTAADALKMFEQWGTEMLSKQGEVEFAKRVVISCEVGRYNKNWDNNELVIWHYNGYHYLRNKNNYVYWQNSGKWAGMYIEDEYRLDEDAAEPDFVNEPPPLVSVEIVEWKCNKRMGCRCN